MSWLAVFAAAFGAAHGSLFNVLVDRDSQNDSLWRRSRCDNCGRTLSPLELVPVLSYLALRGRCRTCGAPIGRRVFAVEAVTACLAAIPWCAEPPSARAFFESGWLVGVAFMALSAMKGRREMAVRGGVAVVLWSVLWALSGQVAEAAAGAVVALATAVAARR